MEQFTFLNNRNKLFLFLYIVGNVVYSIAVLTTIFPFFTHLPYVGLSFCIIFLGLRFTKIPPQVMQDFSTNRLPKARNALLKKT